MPRPARKRDDILAGAARVFRRLGYARSSMDAVAREAGVAKATLYRYFPDKTALFVAMVQAAPPARFPLPPPDGDPEETLRRLGHGIMAAASDPGYVSLARLALGEGERFPELALTLRQQVFERVFPAIERMMAGWIAAGRLRPLDSRLASQEFVGMILSYVVIKHVLPGGIDWNLSDDHVVDQVVSVFLHGATHLMPSPAEA